MERCTQGQRWKVETSGEGRRGGRRWEGQAFRDRLHKLLGTLEDAKDGEEPASLTFFHVFGSPRAWSNRGTRLDSGAVAAGSTVQRGVGRQLRLVDGSSCASWRPGQPPGALRTAELETACEGWVGAGWERGGRKCVGWLGVGAESIFFWHFPPAPLRFPVGLRVGEEGTRGSIRGMMIGKQGGGS